MAKTRTRYQCNACGAESGQWNGQCADCKAWNTLEESVVTPASTTNQSRYEGYAGNATVTVASEVQQSELERLDSGLTELDRVLGGGLVPGSVTLIGGDPGVGKSTLLIQSMACLSQQLPGDKATLYATGEESLQQVSMRAHRIGLPTDKLRLYAETRVESIIETLQRERPRVVVVDSIQTIFTDALNSAPGSVAQVRESAARLVRFAKQTGTAIFLVGHVTKEGALAGPRVLEHMVDTVLYFESDTSERYRVIRAVKNRFGAVNEIGVFFMSDRGLKVVKNPSAIFLSRHPEPVSGSVIMVTREGSRPLLIEAQALVDESQLGNPRRIALGLEQNRLSMLLAVLHRHAGIAMFDQDVFINVVGGVRITETAVDLAILLAAISSLRNKPLPVDLVVFGEVGLAGEVRPVSNGEERLLAAAKQGFKQAIVPASNVPRKPIKDFVVHGIDRLPQALDLIH